MSKLQNKLIQNRDQYFEKAMLRRTKGLNYSPENELLDHTINDLICRNDPLNAGNLTAAVLSLAQKALKSIHSLKDFDDCINKHQDYARTLEDTQKLTSMLVHSKKMLWKKSHSESTFNSYRESLCPAKFIRFSGISNIAPWDARHDGHLIHKKTARALGLVRWSRSLSPERSERIRLAFESSNLSSGNIWTNSTVFFAVTELNEFTENLIASAWIFDHRIGAVIDSKCDASRLLDLGINVFFDTKHHVRALLALPHQPTLISRQLGGVSYLSACGSIDLGCLKEKRIPEWLLLLSQLGVLHRFDAVNKLASLGKLAPPKLKLYLDRLEKILSLQSSDNKSKLSTNDKTRISELQSRLHKKQEVLLDQMRMLSENVKAS